MIVDAELAGKVESGMAIEVDVAFHAEEADAHGAGFCKCVVQEFQPIAFALVVGMDADGAEGPGGERRSVV